MKAQRAEPAMTEVAAALIDGSRDGVVAFDLARRVTVWSPAAASLTGLTSKEMVGRTLARKAPWLGRVGGGRPLVAALQGTAGASQLRLAIGKTGERRTIDVLWRPLIDPDGTVRGGLAILCPVDVPPAPVADDADAPDAKQAERPGAMLPSEPHQRLADAVEALDHAALRVGITELKRREAALRESEERFRALADAAFEAIVVHDDERIIDANPAFVALFGFSHDELLGMDLWQLASPGSQAEATLRIKPRFEQAEQVDQPYEQIMRRKDGSIFPAELRGKPLRYGGRIAGAVAVRDIAARKRSEDHIRRLAHHDSLTELPNRALFLDRLGQAMAQARRDGRPMAILQLDLDHFKDINDTLGHPAGDTLLRACARRLQSILHDTDTVARIGGDEFAIILTGLDQPIDAGHIAQRIIARLLEPISCQGHEVHTGTSIGITIFPDDDTDPDQLLRNADIALYRAKANGRNTYSFFVEAMKRQVERRKELEADLRRAIAGDEFTLHYQPQIRLADRKVVGMEALMRWRHPTRGLVMPSEFLAVAEDAGLIVPIGLEVLSQACAQARAWLDAGLEFGRVTINLAPAQFKARDLAYAINDALQSAGLEAEHIGLEVTEGAFLGRATDRVAQTLTRLHDMNVAIALDDFGTGYASLAHLRRFAIDRLKIDGSLVRDIGIDPGNTAIVRTVISLGHSLGLEVVAEGVETEAQYEFLRQHGCDGAQGYLLGRPIAASEAWHYLDAVGVDALALGATGD